MISFLEIVFFTFLLCFIYLVDCECWNCFKPLMRVGVFPMFKLKQQYEAEQCDQGSTNKYI